jgi:predicted DCC family thiol-disulfide oxidoreductase YuxK
MAKVMVAYDEDCGACRWTADQLRRWDRRGRLGFVSIQKAGALLDPVPVAERLDAMHAISCDGAVFTGGAAVPVIARELPAGAPVVWLAGVMPGATERVYRLAAARRTQIGRWLGQDACAVDPSRAPDEAR